METMTKREKLLAAQMLKQAGEEFGNHGCNDVDESFFIGWSKEERQDLVREYHEWNGDPEEYEGQIHLPDFCIMAFLAHKLETNL